MAFSLVSLLVGFTSRWMQGHGWLRSMVAAAPHGPNAILAAGAGNPSWPMMP